MAKTRNAHVEQPEDRVDVAELVNTTEAGNSSRPKEKKSSRKNKKLKVPVQPLGFFFEPSQFSKFSKIGTRCDPFRCVEFIKNLGGNELRWFNRHPQFKHIFHMHQENNRKVMGAWSFIQRLVKHESVLEEPEDSNIKAVTSGDTPYTSASRFEDLNLSQELMKGLYVEMKFEKPSKIQAISLPMIMTPPHITACFVLGMGKFTGITAEVVVPETTRGVP